VKLHLLDQGGDIAGNGLSKLFLTIAAVFASDQPRGRAEFDPCISGPTLPTREPRQEGQDDSGGRIVSYDELLANLDELGIADNTIVVYSTDRSRERHLAGWHEHAVPLSEGHQLGRRLARAYVPALGGEYQGWFGLQWHPRSHQHGP
jgi:hypothetical protein